MSPVALPSVALLPFAACASHVRLKPCADEEIESRGGGQGEDLLQGAWLLIPSIPGTASRSSHSEEEGIARCRSQGQLSQVESDTAALQRAVPIVIEASRRRVAPRGGAASSQEDEH